MLALVAVARYENDTANRRTDRPDLLEHGRPSLGAFVAGNQVARVEQIENAQSGSQAAQPKTCRTDSELEGPRRYPAPGDYGQSSNVA
jgi:hypothetical protein